MEKELARRAVEDEVKKLKEGADIEISYDFKEAEKAETKVPAAGKAEDK